MLGSFDVIPTLPKVRWFVEVAELVTLVASFAPRAGQSAARAVSRRWRDAAAEAVADVRCSAVGVGDTALQVIAATFPELRSLDVTRCRNVGPNGLRCLASLLRLHTFRLDFTGNFTGTVACAAATARIAAATSLTSLDLAGLASDDDGFALLSALPQLVTLAVSGCHAITAGALRLLAAGRNAGTLRLLRVARCARFTLTRGDEASFAQFRGLTSLTLDVDSRDFSFAAFATLPNLTALEVDRFALMWTGAADRTDWDVLQRFQSLESLALTSAGRGALSDETFAHMATLPCLSRIHLAAECAMGVIGLNDRGLARLASIAGLTELALYDVQDVTSGGWSLLRRLTQLRTMELGACLALDSSAVCSIAVASLTSLSILMAPEMGDVGFQAVCAITRLTSLSLMECPLVSQEGWKSLARLNALESLTVMNAPHLRSDAVAVLDCCASLTTLHLSVCEGLCDDVFVGLRRFPRLSTLELGGNERLTDDGVAAHAHAFPATLTSIDLAGCARVTRRGRLAILAALPAVRLDACEADVE